MLKSGDVDRFVNQPGDKYSIFLVYGPDSGLVSERCKRLAHRLAGDAEDPFNVVRLDADDPGVDADRVANELNTIGLFGDAKLVRLRVGNRTSIAGFNHLLERRAPNRLLIEAGDLSSKSALRVAIERADFGVALPCYGDEQRDLPWLLDGMLRERGQKISAEAKTELMGLLGSDRLLTRQEIEKLSLYAFGKPQIESSDIDAIIADTSALLVDQIIDHVFSGNPAEADRALERALQENQAPDYVLASALRHAIILRNARFQYEAGRSTSDLERDFRIFYKRQLMFRQQLARWTIEALENAIGLLGEGQNLLRNSTVNNGTVLSRTFLTLALAARRARERSNQL
ncbi:MAG: DNA polymerase III subunit delta [Hyphomicrobiales bacterium]